MIDAGTNQVFPENPAALWPAADGSHSIRSKAGSRIPKRPQPLAPGTEKVLSTSLTPATLVTWILPLVVIVPRDPVTGWFGGGGAVVPVVRLMLIGLVGVPMVQL